MRGSRMQRETRTIPPSLNIALKPHPNLIKFLFPERWMSGLSRTPGKREYGESRTAGSNPALSAMKPVIRES